MLAFAIILIVPNVIVSQINKDLEFAYPLNMNGMLVEEVEPDKLLQQIMKQLPSLLKRKDVEHLMENIEMLINKLFNKKNSVQTKQQELEGMKRNLPAASTSGPSKAESKPCPRAAKSAGTQSAGTKSAGTKSAGTQSAGTQSAGAKSAGTQSAGTQSAGAKSTGTQSVGAGKQRKKIVKEEVNSEEETSTSTLSQPLQPQQQQSQQANSEPLALAKVPSPSPTEGENKGNMAVKHAQAAKNYKKNPKVTHVRVEAETEPMLEKSSVPEPKLTLGQEPKKPHEDQLNMEATYKPEISLDEVLKYSQSDWNKQKQELELEFNAQLLNMERKLADRDEQVLLLSSDNKDMKLVVKELEKTIAQLQALSQPLQPQQQQSQGLLVVVDTNILVSNLGFLKNLRDSHIKGHGQPVLYIPWIVLQELDRLKRKHIFKHNTTKAAMQAIRFLYTQFTSNHPRVLGQSPTEANTAAQEFSACCNDDAILQACLYCQRLYCSSGVVLLTNDINLINKALVSYVKAFSSTEFMESVKQIPLPVSSSSKSLDALHQKHALQDEIALEKMKSKQVEAQLSALQAEYKKLQDEVIELKKCHQAASGTEEVTQRESKRYVGQCSITEESQENQGETYLDTSRDNTTNNRVRSLNCK